MCIDLHRVRSSANAGATNATAPTTADSSTNSGTAANGSANQTGANGDDRANCCADTTSSRGSRSKQETQTHHGATRVVRVGLLLVHS